MNVVDAHSDYGIKVLYDQINGKVNSFKNNHLHKLSKGGVNIENLVMGGDFDFYPNINSRLLENIFKVIEVNLKQIREIDRNCIILRSKRDFEKLSSRDSFGFLFSLEGASSIKTDLSKLIECYDQGIRLITLTHNEKNSVGDGIGVIKPKGLTNFGREVVMKMKELGIIIDLSHASIPLFWDVINMIEGPCIASHSNAKALCPHVRNLDDDQINEIGSKDGVIGINLFGGFIDSVPEKANLERLIDHVDHIVDKIGINHVGIGADFLDYAVDDEIELIDTSSESNTQNPARMVYPINKTVPNVSKFFKILETLKNRGYSQKEVRKIAGENFIRVFKSILN